MANNIKVLLVDDNPMVLELLRAAVAPFAAAVTSKNAADALAAARQDVPDLIVSDYAMPKMDGRKMLESLRAASATAKVPVILLASRSEIIEKLKPVESMVEEFIEKPFFVQELSARLKKVVDKILLEKMAREEPGSQVRGSLAQMNVIDLLQSLEMGRKTCALTITTGNKRCVLYFGEGQIQHAICGATTGDGAVYEVVKWPEGNFTIDFESSSNEQTTTQSTQGLLMEGLRLLDESNAADSAG